MIAFESNKPAAQFSKHPRLDIIFLVLAAMLIRGSAMLANPNIHQPDEIFQVMEPAHALLFGKSILAWEFVVGIRSWFFPGLVAGLMAIGHCFSENPDIIRFPVMLFMLGCSMAPVVCGYLWGARLHGQRGGLLVGGILASWKDLIYFAPHTLNEVFASNILCIALYLASVIPEKPRYSQIFIVGMLLGFVVILRFQLSPALLVAGFYICGSAFRSKWLPLISGGAIPLLLSGILDWITLGTPFQSIWLNFWVNIVWKVSAEFGTSDMSFFFVAPFILWGGSFCTILAAAILGSRRAPILLPVALTIFLTHTLIPHKEVRFIYPAIPLLMILAALATADAVAYFTKICAEKGQFNFIFTYLALGFWVLTSFGLGALPQRQVWDGFNAKYIKAFAALSRIPRLCGVAMPAPDSNFAPGDWLYSPGSAGLPAHAPLYMTSTSALFHDAPAFNAILAPDSFSVPDPHYQQMGCYTDPHDKSIILPERACIWVRPGPCDPSAGQIPRVFWPRYFLTPDGQVDPTRLPVFSRHQ